MHNQTFQNLKNKKRGLMATLLVILCLFLLTLTVSNIVGILNKIKEGKYIGQEIETKNTITVSGKGEVYAKPDLVLVSFSVTNEAKTVSQAMQENTEKMNAVIDSIKNQGVEEKDLKTTRFNISPRYEYYKGTGLPIYPTGKRILVGYEISQSLQVKIRDMNKISNIIQGATEVGANQVGDLSFTIDDEEEFKKQARQLAIDKGKAKAQEIASYLGVNLVRITNFSESAVTPFYGWEKTADLGIGGGAPVPQIETGENKVEVSVSITYEIN